MNKVFIKDIIDEIEKIAPISWQESYDNSGLLLGRVDKICNGVFVCLDLTLESLDKAIENKCNLIISHHPFIFNPIKQIDFSTVRGKIIEIAIKNDITIYSSHTNIVPPVFDMLNKNGFFLEQEERLNEINRILESLENNQNYLQLKEGFIQFEINSKYQIN